MGKIILKVPSSSHTEQLLASWMVRKRGEEEMHSEFI